jgi:proteasome accessory factor C
MAKNFRATGQDRFNFLTALAAYAIQNDGISAEEAAAHFEVSIEYVREALSTLNVTGTFIGSFEQFFYNFDADFFDRTGKISFYPENGVIEEVPRLSSKQASALAAGLTYLSSIPEFSSQQEIDELLEILANGSTDGAVQIYDFKPGSVDADALVLRRAILNGHRISCEYVNRLGEMSSREIDPIRLDPRGDIWYLRGYCLKNRELRNFRLDRMRSAFELNQPISDEAKSVGKIVDEEYTVSETDIEVVVEVEPEAYSLITDFGADVQGSEGNTVRAAIKVGYLPTLGRVISHYGGAARVLGPESAKRVVRNYALQALGQPIDDQMTED